MTRRGGAGAFALAASFDAGEHVFEGVRLGRGLRVIDEGRTLNGFQLFGLSAGDLRQIGLDDVADVLGGLILIPGCGRRSHAGQRDRAVPAAPRIEVFLEVGDGVGNLGVGFDELLDVLLVLRSALFEVANGQGRSANFANEVSSAEEAAG